jgi:hypothetical protein
MRTDTLKDKEGRVVQVHTNDRRVSAHYAGSHGTPAFVAVLADGLTMKDEQRIAEAMASIDGVVVVETLSMWAAEDKRMRAKV